MPEQRPPSTIAAWIAAARPRTLPLALASVILGTLLAYADGVANGPVAALCVITASLLQILSNLANDYGDALHGADQTGRKGPRRAVASGDISPQAMRAGLAVTVALTMIGGVALVVIATRNNPASLILFAGWGALAIGAALAYTLGKRPYGYLGLGDVAVLVFFGWTGMLGTYYLQAQRLDGALVLPATSVGLLAVGVLNLNNLRDIDSDRRAGKLTIPVRIGRTGAQLYHSILIGMALLLTIAYVAQRNTGATAWLFLVCVPLFLHHVMRVWHAQTFQEQIRLLKQLSMLTLVFAVLLGGGQVL